MEQQSINPETNTENLPVPPSTLHDPPSHRTRIVALLSLLVIIVTVTLCSYIYLLPKASPQSTLSVSPTPSTIPQKNLPVGTPIPKSNTFDEGVYQNSQYNFSVNLPKNTFIRQMANAQQLAEAIYVVYYQNPISPKTSPQHKVWIMINPTSPVQNTVPAKSHKFGNIEWLYRVEQACGVNECMPPEHTYQTRHNGNVILIKNSDTVEYEEIQSQILSSITLTEDTSN